LKNRLNKTPNCSPDQSLIAVFRKRNSNCIFLNILLARMPLFFMSALLKWIIHRFTSDFYGVFYWVKEIIDKQNSNTKNNEKWKKSHSKFLKIVDEKHDINFHWLIAIPIIHGYIMEIVWIYYGSIYAIANSIVWISLFFSSALSLGRVVHVSVQITGVLCVTLRHV
jgi:hypothetical protein